MGGQNYSYGQKAVFGILTLGGHFYFVFHKYEGIRGERLLKLLSLKNFNITLNTTRIPTEFAACRISVRFVFCLL